MGGVDVAVLSLLALAVARGLWIGAVREAFSLGALVAAVVVVRIFTAEVASWLAAQAPDTLSPLAARLAAGALLALLTVTAVGLAGRLVRRGVQAAGLGLLDRLAGAALGAAEGALAVVLAMFLAATVLGAQHPTLAASRSAQLLDHLGLLPPPDGTKGTNKGDVRTKVEQRGRCYPPRTWGTVLKAGTKVRGRYERPLCSRFARAGGRSRRLGLG